MGGNAIGNVRRYQAQEYHVLASTVTAKLRSMFPGHRLDIIKSYREKESFGDLDILIESFDFGGINWRSLLTETFDSRQVVSNGHTHSLEYQDFQVDLILMPTFNYDSALSYYAWNDLGNLMGRIAHKLGFKYGHEGLVYVFRENNYEFGQIIVTKDPAKICQFLGYDPITFLHGFNTKAQIFEFATSTPFFNKDIFAYENRNHQARVRDKKRANYREFLDWIQYRSLPAYPWDELTELGGRLPKTKFLDRAFEMFPTFKEKHESMLVDFHRWKEARERFNGKIVSGVTGLQGKELGDAIQKLKSILPDRDTLLIMTSVEIEAWIKRNLGM